MLMCSAELHIAPLLWWNVYCKYTHVHSQAGRSMVLPELATGRLHRPPAACSPPWGTDNPLRSAPGTRRTRYTASRHSGASQAPPHILENREESVVVVNILDFAQDHCALVTPFRLLIWFPLTSWAIQENVLLTTLSV